MTRKDCHPFMFSTALSVLVPAALTAVSPTAGVAQDTILPLKIKVGDKAPDFALPSIDGKTVRLSQFAGHNVLIDFYRGYW